MKNVKYILFTILFLFLNIFYVEASCTNEELTALRSKVADIKITYKHLGKIETDEQIYYNKFEVNVKNLSDDFYIIYADDADKIVPGDKLTLDNGSYNFRVYSNRCEDELGIINVFLPRFNMYSLDPLCEGIDGNDFPLCGKYYEYDVDYDNFVDRVNHYRNTYRIDEKVEKEENEVSMFESILKYLNEYRLYIVLFFVFLLLLIILFIAIKKIRRRGVLE